MIAPPILPLFHVAREISYSAQGLAANDVVPPDVLLEQHRRDFRRRRVAARVREEAARLRDGAGRDARRALREITRALADLTEYVPTYRVVPVVFEGGFERFGIEPGWVWENYEATADDRRRLDQLRARLRAGFRTLQAAVTGGGDPLANFLRSALDAPVDGDPERVGRARAWLRRLLAAPAAVA